MKSFDDHIKNPLVAEHPLLQGYKSLKSFSSFVEKRAKELKAYQESLTPDDLKSIFMSNKSPHTIENTFSHREMVFEASKILNDTLVQFNIPINPKVSYLRVRDAKCAKNDNTRLVSGVVLFDVELTSLSNVKKHATVPVNVIRGEAVPPSIMEVDQALYVIAQDAFDHIIERITSYELPELRTMFEPPLTHEEREAAVGLRNSIGWQPRRNEGYLMQPTEGAKPRRQAVQSTPSGFSAVLSDLEAAESSGEDTFPRSWDYVLRHYILNQVSTASKDQWMHHLINKGYVLNPYGPTNRGRKSGSKEAQFAGKIMPPSNPEVISALANFIGQDQQLEQLYEDWTNGDSVPADEVDYVQSKLEQMYSVATQSGNQPLVEGLSGLIRELDSLTPEQPQVQAYKQAQGFPELDNEDDNGPMEKEIEMEVSGKPEPMENILEEIGEVLQKYYPGTKTPIEPSDNVKFNGQRGCIVEVDAENDFLIVKSKGMEYRVKVEEVEPLPGTFKKMFM